MERKTATVDETATELGLCRESVYEAIRRGEIPAIRIGKRLLIPRDALNRMLAGEKQFKDGEFVVDVKAK